MKLIPYEPWHYEYIAGTTIADQNMDKDAVRLFATAYYLRGSSFSIEHEGHIVGCAGIIDLWTGVGEAWTMLSRELCQHPFFVHRKTFRIMRDIIRLRRFHRIQAVVNPKNPVAVKWIERLGFSKESTMKKFNADGTDSAMYVWSQ